MKKDEEEKSEMGIEKSKPYNEGNALSTRL